ncbi:MAG: hypothetical protein ACTSVV_15815 [Promethearchaeota archaeon]
MKKAKKTIEIDDAGTGDLIGDAFIGFHVVETGKIIFKSVPVGLYNEENLKNNAPKKRILEIVKEGLKELDYQPGDIIYLCSGDCFDLVREYFDENNIKYITSKIEGKLQDAVEGRFVSHLRKLGVRSKKLTKKAGAQRYFVLWNWLCEDFPARERFVKKGYKSWKNRRRQMAIERYQRNMQKKQNKRENQKKR